MAKNGKSKANGKGKKDVSKLQDRSSWHPTFLVPQCARPGVASVIVLETKYGPVRWHTS